MISHITNIFYITQFSRYVYIWFCLDFGANIYLWVCFWCFLKTKLYIVYVHCICCICLYCAKFIFYYTKANWCGGGGGSSDTIVVMVVTLFMLALLGWVTSWDKVWLIWGNLADLVLSLVLLGRAGGCGQSLMWSMAM